MELAKSITKALGGDWRGSYGLVPGLGHSDNDRSMKIAQHPDNPNDVVLHSFAGDGWRSFKDYLRSRRLLLPWQAKGQARPAGNSREFKPNGNKADNREGRIKQAQKLWAEALPANGTLVESYLRSRCINLRVPKALRFDPNCYYDHDTSLPAMIAALWHHQEQRIVAVHRTFINPSGTGKADVETPKKSARSNLRSWHGLIKVRSRSRGCGRYRDSPKRSTNNGHSGYISYFSSWHRSAYPAQ